MVPIQSNNEAKESNMNLEDIKAKVYENKQAGRYQYDGLDSSDIGTYNRSVMFGDDDEAFPEEDEWSSWTD